MIELYTFPTPNGWKASIALEELELPYELKLVNIARGEQFEPAFLEVNPNNRVPAIVDREPAGGGEPLRVFESGAILLYLAEKTGRLLPSDFRRRVAASEWLMWQMGGLGPMCGQAGHFRNYAPEPIEYGIERYTNEALRLYGVLDGRLEGREFIADEYSVADIACWPWIALHGHHGVELERFPNVNRWYEAIGAREAVKRGTAVGLEAVQQGQPIDEEAKKHLFGRGRPA
jgi:GST-like protein